jgi:predicted DNA-binding transcriptional regulator YafY
MPSTHEGKKLHTVAEVAALTGFSVRTVTRMFEREKGVLILERPESMHKRSIEASAYLALCMGA